MLVVLMLGGNNTLLDLDSAQTATQIPATVMSIMRILVVARAAAIVDFILLQRLPMLGPDHAHWAGEDGRRGSSRPGRSSRTEAVCR